MFDISVNLTNKQFKKDISTVINRAIKNKVNGMLIISCNLKDSLNAYNITKKYKNYCWSTVGIHPHYANLWENNSINKIEKLLKYKNIVAIGECGLDFYRNFSSQKKQLLAFNTQLELAASYSVPIYLHCRNAFSFFFKILKFWNYKISKIIIHCFSGNKYELEKCLDMNMSIGLSELFFNKKYRIGSINDVELIPKEKLLIGTDSPFLLFKEMYFKIYKKFKGRNEPSLLPNLLKKIVSLREETYSILDIQTEKNAFNIFNLN
ncbi:hydrolase TatD [Enterobacteriaceae endosymbiont of Donacia bicoloricornis]|uniref:TatD family hydrolase n=1 Tax=Enterobacteriaceae endosymbiont of Donacia bicoloricornis TaxID=2675772 RepID=UPI00144A15C4|nr:TatD family hydrolase [Enterobacteriaceae endosymbiont of Donacia bicoloricornis]QJC37804.1 hydrolase TatD [Enterobacteriaceae endosymbiont of Donacia bicoloricornis]